MFRRIGLPLLLIIVIALFQKWIGPLTSDAIGYFLYVVINACLLFSLGLSLNTYKKTRGQQWLGKVLVSMLLIFFIFYQLNWLVVVDGLSDFFAFIGLTNFIIYLVYIFCGWIFFS
ncbi:MAG: hypothetical protein R3Y57_06345 [Erysipelotrichaceae bacterium]